MTLVKFQVAHQEQLTETLIHNPDYITSVPDVTSNAIDELLCETFLLDKKLCIHSYPT